MQDFHLLNSKMNIVDNFLSLAINANTKKIYFYLFSCSFSFPFDRKGDSYITTLTYFSLQGKRQTFSRTSA